MLLFYNPARPVQSKLTLSSIHTFSIIALILKALNLKKVIRWKFTLYSLIQILQFSVKPNLSLFNSLCWFTLLQLFTFLQILELTTFTKLSFLHFWWEKTFKLAILTTQYFLLIQMYQLLNFTLIKNSLQKTFFKAIFISFKFQLYQIIFLTLNPSLDNEITLEFLLLCFNQGSKYQILNNHEFLQMTFLHI